MKDGKLKHKQGHCLGFTADLHLEKKIRGSEKMLQIQSFFFTFQLRIFLFFWSFSFYIKIVFSCLNRQLFFSVHVVLKITFFHFFNRGPMLKRIKPNPR